MALVNHAKKEINAKIVYFGPAESGKSTALTYVYSRIKPSLRGELRSVPAGADKLLFFDFSPFDAPLPNGYHLRLHVYTLSGTVTNPATWKMTLKGTDGVMIMINPDVAHVTESRESISQLRDFLAVYGVGLNETPAVLQLNNFSGESEGSDAAQTAFALDLGAIPACCSNAVSGDGLIEALTILSRQVLERVTAKDYPEEAEMAPVGPSQNVSEFASPQTDATVPEGQNDKLSLDHDTQENVFHADDTLSVEVLKHNIVSGVGTIRIPLKITQGNTLRTVVVTVSVALE